ncbi:Uncharacterised protein [Vibrio cholerae]|nr:Uncharacterised protein [Vibrio cholerae]
MEISSIAFQSALTPCSSWRLLFGVVGTPTSAFLSSVSTLYFNKP